MSSFTYRTKDGHRRYCTCYRSECSIECGLYRKYTGIKTNYDTIVSKTPEELAEYIRVFFPEACPPGNCPGEDYCYKCWLDWLKSPVEVDNGN